MISKSKQKIKKNKKTINIYFVYFIENIITKEIYVGLTSNFDNRKKQHIYSLNNNKHHSSKLQTAWNNYTMNDFHFRVVSIFNEFEDTLNYENSMIHKHGEYNIFEKDYNMDDVLKKLRKNNNSDIKPFI